MLTTRAAIPSLVNDSYASTQRPTSLPVPLVVGIVLAAEIYLAVVHRAAFAPLFARHSASAARPRLEPATRHAA